MLPRLLSRTTVTDDGSRTLTVGAGVEPVEGIEGGLDAVLGRERSSSAWARRAVSCSTRWKICDMWRVSIGTNSGVRGGGMRGVRERRTCSMRSCRASGATSTCMGSGSWAAGSGRDAGSGTKRTSGLGVRAGGDSEWGASIGSGRGALHGAESMSTEGAMSGVLDMDGVEDVGWR